MIHRAPFDNVDCAIARVSSLEHEEALIDDMARQIDWALSDKALAESAEFALECLVQLACRNDAVGLKACHCLKQWQASHSVSGDFLPVMQKLKAFAFNAYHLAARDKFSAFKPDTMPVYILHLAGTHARDESWPGYKEQIERTLTAQLPASKVTHWCGASAPLPLEAMEVVSKQKRGCLAPGAGVVNIQVSGIPGNDVDCTPDELHVQLKAIGSGPRMWNSGVPISFTAGKNRIHGIFSSEAYGSLTLLHSPDVDESRIQSIGKMLSVKAVKAFALPEANDAAMGELLFHHCGQTGHGDVADDCQRFARRFSELTDVQKLVALDGARARALDSWARAAA